MRFYRFAALIILLGSCRHEIQVSNYLPYDYSQASAFKGDSVRFSIIETGGANTKEAFVYESGSLFKSVRLSHIAVWVKHPKGEFLFDTGLGDSISSQFSEMSWLHGKMFNYEKGKSVKDQLKEDKLPDTIINKIILSHLHWDHASGIKDFPDATVITTKEEFEYAMSDNAHSPAFLKSQYDGIEKWSFMEFNSGKYKYFEKSCDYFGDGTVVFVPLQGHTCGSIGMFLTMPDRRCYFFTGDVTWSVKAFIKPAHKNKIPSCLVDHDHRKLTNTIIQIHRLALADTTIKLVPAHDYNTQKGLAHFPDFER